MSDFTHLHVHSDGSTPVSHDGLGSVHRLVTAAKSLNFDNLALTDHGNLLNVPSFLSACESADIKPIVGMEAYIENSNETYHLTLLADGNDGFNTLVNLNNIAQQSTGHRPTFKLTDFERHNKDILVLTGCPASPLQDNDWNTAQEIGIYLKNIFGNRLFAEMMFVGFDELLERSVKLAKDLKLQLVVTNDSHFPYASDAKAHEVLTSIRGGYDYPSDYLYLASVNDLTKRVKAIAPKYLKYLEQGIKNAHKIGTKIDSVQFENKISLPFIENADKNLLDLIYQNCYKRYGHNIYDTPKEIIDRLNYEYQIISEMQFSTYFLILNDIVSFAKANGVKVGSGRGSGAGSLILYILGITDINPLEFDLKFERFINPKRLDFPDVDIDYDSVGRGKVIEYAKNRWNGIPVATYSRYSEKSLIADLCRHFKIDKSTDRAMRDEGYNGEIYKKIASEKPLFDDCYKAIIGQIRHTGKHAGGIIITDKNIPTIRTSSGEIVASWTEGLSDKELSKVGVVKFDILGITALDILKDLETKYGKAPHPYDNAPEYELFRIGNTLGIFQFTGSSGIVNFTKRVQPYKFSDLVAINALWRPGPMQGSAPHYVEYKKNGQRLLHPLIDDILDETYGVICYQEQFMSIYARMTDKDFGDADIARKVLVKGQGKENNPEWKLKLGKLKDDFMIGCKNKGVPENTANLIWSEISTHSGYSFNKSHAVSYTMLAWQMAYYKYHYLADFYAAMLTHDQTNTEDYIYDVIRSGIEISLPDVNKSEKNRYVAVDDVIYMPLTSVKFISDASSDNIIDNRPFLSYTDFSERTAKKQVNKRAKKALYYVGALNSLSGKPEDMGIEIEPLNQEQIQEQYLGFILPKPAFFKAVEKALRKGMLAGIVNTIKDKISTYSGKPYQTYSLFPDGYFYSYVLDVAKVGEEIQVNVIKDKNNNNRLKQVMELEY